LTPHEDDGTTPLVRIVSLAFPRKFPGATTRIAFAPVVAIALLACGGDSGSGGGFGGSSSGGNPFGFGGSSAGSAGAAGFPPPEAGAGGVGGNAGSSSGGGAAPSGGSARCDAYVACVAQANPAALGPIADAYGKKGNCFDQGDGDLCDQACLTGLIQTHKMFPLAAACNYCDSSADCPAAAPVCDPATHTCKECGKSADCKDSSRPACDVAAFTCVACTSSAQCDPSSKNPVCVSSTHTCGPCTGNADCADQVQSGRVFCGTSGKCRGCQSDAECGGDTCRTDGFCGGCKVDADCSKGLCDYDSGTCCGSTACADQGAECGVVQPTDCTWVSPGGLACGSCTKGTVCVENKCVPPPPKECSATCGPNEYCGYDANANERTCAPAYPSASSLAYCGKAGEACSPRGHCAFFPSPDDPSVGNNRCAPDCLTSSDCPPETDFAYWYCKAGPNGTAGVCLVLN
jgi:hypothetical protein